jgi:hypothetical protein
MRRKASTWRAGSFFFLCPARTSSCAGHRLACGRITQMPAVAGTGGWPLSGQRRSGNRLETRVRGWPRIADRCGAGNGGGRDTAASGRYRAEYCGRHSADPESEQGAGMRGHHGRAADARSLGEQRAAGDVAENLARAAAGACERTVTGARAQPSKKKQARSLGMPERRASQLNQRGHACMRGTARLRPAGAPASL